MSRLSRLTEGRMKGRSTQQMELEEDVNNSAENLKSCNNNSGWTRTG